MRTETHLKAVLLRQWTLLAYWAARRVASGAAACV
jgi:hypothetical protein